eukprot:gb/GFBE01002170.1/.p1 GENE.gb/GFBE01002170.1/~~gb/GFBE01002170.1/.p1  ORF type:complete len:378 (+),score=83.18 gb/GFBE01002170.1/:1-1134(+)
MVFWANSGRFPGAAFMCICVDPNALGTAKEFSQLYFSAAPASLINGYIDKQEDFPSFQAQLGCQGFVIFDSSCTIVVPRTLPWLQHRDNAFRDVEGKVMQMLQPNFENPLNAPIGQSVRVVNLTSEAGQKLVGQVGEVVGSSSNGRYMVKLPDCTKALRAENLEDAMGAPVGKRVRVAGLTSAKGSALNGLSGEVLGGTSTGRYLVKLESGTMALLPENVVEIASNGEEEELLSTLPSVGHEGMDQQHDSCVSTLRTLLSKLSVQSLRRVRDELVHHFAEEETLLRGSGFGSDTCDSCAEQASATSGFSALGSHIKDHHRIIAMAEDALTSLKDACESAEGSVPKAVALDMCKAFAEHATLYDALYEGKVAAAAAAA